MRFYCVLFSVLAILSNHSFAQWEEGADEITLIVSQAHFTNAHPDSRMKEIIFENNNPLVMTLKFHNGDRGLGAMTALQTALGWSKIKNSQPIDFFNTVKVEFANNDPKTLNELFRILKTINRAANENLERVKEKGLALLSLRENVEEKAPECRRNFSREPSKNLDNLLDKLAQLKVSREERSSPILRQNDVLEELDKREASREKTFSSIFGSFRFRLRSEAKIVKILKGLSDSELRVVHKDCLETHYESEWAGSRHESDSEGEERTAWLCFYRVIKGLIEGELQARGFVEVALVDDMARPKKAR